MRYLLLIALFALPLEAREKLQGWCEQGGQTVTTNGVVSTTFVQRSYKSCTVTVYNAGTLTLSTIYADNAGTPKANPFTASSLGLWFFYASDGRYDVAFSGGGIATPFTLGDFSLLDLSGGYITSINSQTGPAITLATATTGTNFTIAASGNAITFAIPNASSTARGLLTNTDWTAFNNKESPLTFNAPLSRSVNTVSLTTPISIANGGSGQITANAAFNAFAPTTTAGDLIIHNGTINTRVPIALSSGQCFKSNLLLTSKVEWGSCFGGTITVPDGGTGATTLTGSLVGNGTSAFTAVAASSPLQFYRRQPNVSATTYQFTDAQILSSADFNFPSQAPGGTLTMAVGASPTLTPCPLGLNGADSNHYLYISGGVGSAEAVLVTGGTCTSGASTGTVTFTPANNHSGAWTITSATQGIQEAICYLPAADNVVRIPSTAVTLNANVSTCGKTNVAINIANGATFSGSGALPTTVASGLQIQDNRVSNIAATGARSGNAASTGQTAAITTTSLVASAPAGLYRLSGYMQTTTASAGVCTSDVTFGWTYNSSAKTLQVVSNHDQAVDETYSQIPTTIIRSQASANITYAVSLDAGGGDCSSATFDVYIVAERLQ